MKKETKKTIMTHLKLISIAILLIFAVIFYVGLLIIVFEGYPLFKNFFLISIIDSIGLISFFAIGIYLLLFILKNTI